MTDQQAHLQFIIEHPEDDLARLVYADFLEDHGQAEQAEFIRVQIAISKLDDELMSREDCGSSDCPGCTERRILQQREKELRVYCQDWLPIPGYIWYGKGGVFCVGGSQEMPMNAKPHYSVEFRRGLAEQIADISLEDWIGNGEKIYQHHPIQEVVINNRTPSLMPSHPREKPIYCWLKESTRNLIGLGFLNEEMDGPAMIPDSIMGLMSQPERDIKQYPSSQLAYQDLSQACIRLFRQKKSTSLA